MKQNTRRATPNLKTRIVIYVDGGIVQDVLSDTASVEVMIVDYDNERAGEDPADRSFEPVDVNPKYIEKTTKGTEN